MTHTPHITGNIAFIGGGNMASALIGGLIQAGTPLSRISVVEPYAQAQAALKSQFNLAALDRPGAALESASLVVWAIKPQVFKEVAIQTRFHTKQALHLSVAAGINSSSISQWLDVKRVVRAMPNTPALIGRGITGLFAREAVQADDRQAVEQVITPTGQLLWLQEESQLDAVTALSGSGPAYVFYFLDAMAQAGDDMGLPRDQALQLAIATFAGAAELAQQSNEPPEILRQRVTSKGGTTHAAIHSMEQDNVRNLFMRALHAAKHRARELGEEFGR
jgi:pyrroline-5-carboxylate reductase